MLYSNARILVGEDTLTLMAAIDAEVEAQVDDAVLKARAAAYPAPEDLLTDVYVSY